MLPVRAQQVIVSPSGDQIVLTDPVVRTTQLGYIPVGTLLQANPNTGVAVALVPGAGTRLVRIAGRPTATVAGFVAPAVDLATGVRMQVTFPRSPEQLVRARVLRASANGVTVRRLGLSASQAEILPVTSVYVTWSGTTLPATTLPSRLTPGATVLIPTASGPRGAIQVETPSRSSRPAAKPGKR
jgi:hypothetical protein